jgi:hypothetical protein
MFIDCNMAVSSDRVMKDNDSIRRKHFGDAVVWLILNNSGGPISVELVEWSQNDLPTGTIPISLDDPSQWQDLPDGVYTLCEATVIRDGNNEGVWKYKTQITYEDGDTSIYDDPELEIIGDRDEEKAVRTTLSETLNLLSKVPLKDSSRFLFPFGIQTIRIKVGNTEVDIAGTVPPKP